jgi:uncharacterized protein with PIN domain
VTARFYAQLNDFLPRARRGIRFVHHLVAPASVKDVIESLGVPHVEVVLFLINGAPAAFSALVDDEDDVAVFPVFRALTLDPSLRVGTVPPPPIRFALDTHLGRLASLLRLAGFDAVMRQDDDALADVGARESRVVLTRDVALLKRRIIAFGYWVRHTDPEWQLAELLDRFDLVDRLAPFTRCTECNTPLVDADAAAVADRLLPCTRAEHDTFRECPGCRRVYWKGSHFPHLQAILERARSRAAQSGHDPAA